MKLRNMFIVDSFAEFSILARETRTNLFAKPFYAIGAAFSSDMIDRVSTGGWRLCRVGVVQYDPAMDQQMMEGEASMTPLETQESSGDRRSITRRSFVKIAGLSALWASSVSYSSIKTKGVSIVIDPADHTAGSPPSQWAVKELEKSLTSEGINVYRCDQIAQARSGDLCIVVAGSDSPVARQLLKDARTNIPSVTEALGLVPVTSDDKQVLLACGYDVRGLVYALLELADRVQYSNRPVGLTEYSKACC